MAVREGRLEDRPMRIKAELFPYEFGMDVEPLLAELAGAKAHGNGAFILRYEVSGRRYLEISNFSKHQKCHVKEPASTLPGPNRAKPGDDVSPPVVAGANPPESESVTESVNGVGVGKPEPARFLTGPEREDYARTVWDAWLKRRGRGGPEMSTAEWDWLAKVMDSQVPLRVVLQGIADCRGKLDPKKPLLYAKPAIEAEAQRWRRAMTA
jgi:hypothetical protein